jgi:Fur family ferric uptake transcriptional regulator
MKNILKEKGYKATPARLAILEIFNRNKLPMDAEEIYKKLKNKNNYKKNNEATVYRTLSSLEAGNILKRVDLRKDSVYFELNNSHHHHIVCTNCNELEDFENKEVEKALERIMQKSSRFKIIKEHSLELFGLCRACA